MTKFGPTVAKIAAFARFVLRKRARTLYIGVRACRPRVCRRAFARFKENMSVGTYSFWASCGISLKGAQAERELFAGACATSRGFRTCVLSESAGAVSGRR